MASSANRFDSRDPASADEIDVLFGTANPNPDRTGCPPPETLEALARHELPMEHPAYVHLAECSPCYEEFVAYRQEVDSAEPLRLFDRRAVRWAAVAALLVLLAVSGWFFARRGGEPNAPPTRAALSEARLGLDLRPYTVSRSEANLPAQPPLALSQRRLALSLLLPVGSEPGAYQVQLLGDGTQVAASASGQAEIVNFVTTLRVALDLSAVPVGDYRLAVRRDGDAWSFYPATVR
jgi:hypothetical protein